MKRYECDQCGACCKGTLIIEVDDLDVMREPRLKGADAHHRGKLVPQMVYEIQHDFKAVYLAGWHRLARSGAYLCALAQEARIDKHLFVKTSFGSAAPVAHSSNRGHPAEPGSPRPIAI